MLPYLIIVALLPLGYLVIFCSDWVNERTRNRMLGFIAYMILLLVLLSPIRILFIHSRDFAFAGFVAFALGALVRHIQNDRR